MPFLSEWEVGYFGPPRHSCLIELVNMRKPNFSGSRRSAKTITALSDRVTPEQDAGWKEEFEARAADPMADAEDMLLSQAQTMDHIFHDYAVLARANLRTNARKAERFMELALKCQNNSRQTIMTLMALKNPKRATFVKNQQNVLKIEPEVTTSLGASDNCSHGYQQQESSNNGAPTVETVGVDRQPGNDVG